MDARTLLSALLSCGYLDAQHILTLLESAPYIDIGDILDDVDCYGNEQITANRLIYCILDRIATYFKEFVVK